MSLFAFMSPEPFPYPSEPKYVLRETLRACEEIQAYLCKVVEKAPETAIVKISHPNKPAENPTRVFDSEAEEWFRTEIKTHFAEPIEVFGEEDPRLPGANFVEADATIFLVDMVDGSDLLDRHRGSG